MKKSPNKKSLDWTLKNYTDASHIDEKLKKRTKKASETELSAKCAKGEPLERLHQNIEEIFDAPEEDDYKPFFKISLVGEEDNNEQTKDEEELTQKKSNDLRRITKEQQMVGKLNIIMSTAIAADEAGLPSKATSQDSELANTAEYDLPKLRRKTIKEKIENPLDLEGEIPEEKLESSISAIKKVKKKLSTDSLEGMPADELFVLDKEDDPNALAKLILQKTGRRLPKTKKKLSDIAKDLNQLEQDGITAASKKESD